MHLIAYAILSFDLLVLSKLAGCLQLICFVTFQVKTFQLLHEKETRRNIALFTIKKKKRIKIKLFHPNLWREVLRPDHIRRT